MAFGQISLKGRALASLARREHSRSELERKLSSHVGELPLEEARRQIAQVLDDLTAQGLLSDQRAAETLVAGRSSRMGSRRLQQALQHKGVARELIDAVLSTVQATEFDRALALWKRRFAQPPHDAREQSRQVRFLIGRGFSSDVVRSVVRRVSRGEDATAIANEDDSATAVHADPDD